MIRASQLHDMVADMASEHGDWDQDIAAVEEDDDEPCPGGCGNYPEYCDCEAQKCINCDGNSNLCDCEIPVYCEMCGQAEPCPCDQHLDQLMRDMEDGEYE